MARTLVLLPLTLLLLTACSTGSSVEDAPTVDAADGEVSDGEVSDGEVDADIEVTAPVDPTADAAGATASASASDQLHPDVVDAEMTEDGDGTFTAAVTLSSPYDTPERYADAWRVLSPDGEELGIRELAHDHAAEQPFTRSQSGIAIPDDVVEVTIQGRDQENGWGGDELTIAVPGR